MIEKIGDLFPNEYMLALAVLIVLAVFIRLAFLAAGRLTMKSSMDSRGARKKRIAKNYSRALTVLAVFIAIPLSLKILPVSGEMREIIRRLSYTAIAIAAACVVYSLIENYMLGIIRRMGGKKELGESLQPILRSIARILLIVLAGIYVLGVWGVQVAPLLAGLGIAGLALALALQPLLGNLFNGLALVLDETFKVGDVIKLSTGEMGEVYRVGLRTTKVKTFDNEMFIIPNTKLADSILQNFFQPDKSIRVTVDFGVEYGTDPEYVKKIAIEEVAKISFIDKAQEIRVLFTEMAESSLNFRSLFWVDDISKRWPAHQEAISRIYRRLYEEKIGIPFPQRTVWVREEGKAEPVSPADEKFKTVRGKYYPKFGHEYTEESPAPEKEDKRK